MIKKFKEAIDTWDTSGALLTDFSKAFDCINHPLLIAKIDSYGVSSLSTKITFYLSNRTQRTLIKNSFNKRSNIMQGSILGSLLFYYMNVKKMILLAILITQRHALEEMTVSHSRTKDYS